MQTIKAAMQNAFQPRVSISVRNVDMNPKLPMDVLRSIHALFKYTRETMLDTKNGVLYLGKKD